MRAAVGLVLIVVVWVSACSSSEREGQEAVQSPASSVFSAGADTLVLRYFGAAGWEIAGKPAFGADSTPGPVVLVDPYLTRAKYGTNRSWDPTDTRPTYTRADTIISDAALLDQHVPRADFILVQHSHPDHIMDVPYLALRTGAVVIGHESAINVMRAYDVPADQLITVRGGEDYDFGDVSIRVIPSLHSPLNDKRYFQSAVIPETARRPMQISELVEGGSLMFLVRIAGHEVLTMGSMNYIEREVEGLRPDVALVGAAPSHLEITNYTSRLMEALGYPPYVFPTHADNFQAPYGSDIAYRSDWVDAFIAEVHEAAPDAFTAQPRHLEFIEISLP